MTTEPDAAVTPSAPSELGQSSGEWPKLNPFTVVDKGTPMFAQIADQLVGAIESGQWPVGVRLPSEASLAERFAVSRASVREALSSLQFAGYLESRRGSGTVVRAAVAAGTGKLRDLGLRRPGDIIDLLEARLLVEPEAVRRAAVDPVPAALAHLVELLEGMELSLDEPHVRAHTDFGVHLALVRACPNAYLASVAESLIVRTDGSLWRSIRDQAWDDGRLPRVWLGHHEAIGRAVAEHRADDAEAVSREHLLSVLTNVAATAVLLPEDRAKVEALSERHGDPSPAPGTGPDVVVDGFISS